MTDYLRYDLTTGRIVKVGINSATDVAFLAESGEGVLAVSADDETQYILNGAVTSRPTPDLSALSSATLGQTITLTGLPVGAVVSADPGDSETVPANGEMEVTFADATTVVISVSEVFPSMAASIEVDIS